MFGNNSRFGEQCSFGEWCSFGKSCSFDDINLSLLRANLGNIGDSLCTELMKHDAENHPKPRLFDKWAKGGVCPYSIDPPVGRAFFFKEKRKLWEKGSPKLRGLKLLKKICEDKKWWMKGLTK